MVKSNTQNIIEKQDALINEQDRIIKELFILVKKCLRLNRQCLNGWTFALCVLILSAMTNIVWLLMYAWRFF